MQLLRTKITSAMHVLYTMTTTDTNWRHTIQNKHTQKKSRMLESIVQCLRLGTGTDRSGVTRSRCSVIKCHNRSLSVRMPHAVFFILLMTACIWSPPCSPWSAIPKPQVSIHAVTWFSRKCCFGVILVLGNWRRKKSMYTCIFVSAIWMSSGDTGLSCPTAACTPEYALFRCENLAAITAAFSTKV